MIGSTLKVHEAEDDYRENMAQEIATRAAHPIAAREKSEDEAIKDAVKELQQERAADNDVTGTLNAEISDRQPDTRCPEAQIKAIRNRIIDKARDAADKNF